MFKLASLFVDISAPTGPLDASLKKVHGNLAATSSVFSRIAHLGGAGIASGVNLMTAAVGKLQGTSLSGVSRDISMVAGAAGLLGGSFGRNAASVGVLASAFSRISGGGGGGGTAQAAANGITGLNNIFGRFGMSLGGMIQGITGVASSFLGMGASSTGVISSILGTVRAFSMLANLIPGVGQAIYITTAIVTTLGQVMTSAVGAVLKFGESFLKFGGMLIGNVVSAITQVIGVILKLASTLVGGVIAGVNALAGALGRLANAAIGPAMIAGVAGLAALGYGINKAVHAASALNESVSKIAVVFGAETSKVMALADKLADSFGLPKRAIIDAASMFGLVGTGAGFTQKEAAKLSTTMTKLAADVTSFHNIPLEAALEKIRAGLVGESEPLRSLGVMLTEQAVALEGVRMGLAKTGKELDQNQKIMARASLITKGLATATGDLERTAGSTENQFRRLGGNIENTLAIVGKAFLPLATQMAKMSSGTVDKLREAFQKNLGSIETFLASTSVRLERFHNFLMTAIDSSGLGAFAATAANAFMKFGASLEVAVLRAPELFRLFRDSLVNAFGPLATSAMGALGIQFTDFSSMAGSALEAVELGLRNLPEYAQIAALLIQEKFQQAATIFYFVRDTAMEAATSIYKSFYWSIKSVMEIAGAIVTGFSQVFSVVIDIVSGSMDSMTGNVIGPAMAWIGAAFKGLAKMITDAFGAILSPLIAVLSALGNAVGGVWTNMADEFSKALDKIKNAKMPELPNQDKAIGALKDRIAANEAALKIEQEADRQRAAAKKLADDLAEKSAGASGMAIVQTAAATAAGVDKEFKSHRGGIADIARDLRAAQIQAMFDAKASAAAKPPEGPKSKFENAMDAMDRWTFGPKRTKDTLTKEMEKDTGRDIRPLDDQKRIKAGIDPVTGNKMPNESRLENSAQTLLQKTFEASLKEQEKQTELLRFGLVVGMK